MPTIDPRLSPQATRDRRRRGAAIVCLVAGIVSLATVRWLHSYPPSARPPVSVNPSAADLCSFAGRTMGGTWSIKLRTGGSAPPTSQIEESVSRVLDGLDRQMSIWMPQSNLSEFNRSRGTDWYPVSSELAKVVGDAQQVSEQTHGAFDVTVGPLVLLWGFGPTYPGQIRGIIPTDASINLARNHTGYQKLHFRATPPALRKDDPELGVDLGGIAKGFAADAVGNYLESIGVRDYLIAVGGEVRARGHGAQSLGWRVGIETPTTDIRRIIREIDLQDESVSTSGDYRNFFESNGKRYCHEINPHTGRPIDSRLASVTVLHSSGTYADAMATALMVLGPEAGYSLATSRHISALLILRGDHQFQTLATGRMLEGASELRWSDSSSR